MLIVPRLLKKAAEVAYKKFSEENIEDAAASKDIKAIAHATASLFKLEPHGTACKQQWKCDGIEDALKATNCCDSGVKP